ncbi:MAG: hypothetical protein HC917_21580 [Richelia sp. SM2_1_7]|nr:hypothetical protein [Richelia sp. SM2_1_7]
MIEKEINSNPEVFSVLSQYPKWLSMIIEAIDKPILDKSYCPEVIEIFDQYGLLAGKIHGLSSYECIRNTLKTLKALKMKFIVAGLVPMAK